MALIDDGRSVHTIGPGGEKQHAHATELKMNGEVVYQMNELSGVLKICASPEDVQKLIKILGGLPAKELILPAPIGQDMHFFNVQRIESVVTKDGSFMLRLA